jgi:hypothetical protein
LAAPYAGLPALQSQPAEPATSESDHHLRAHREPQAAFEPEEVAAVLGIRPEILRAMIRLARSSLPDARASRRPGSLHELIQPAGLEPEATGRVTAGQPHGGAADSDTLISRDSPHAFLRGDDK